nr:porin [Rosenbergiella metrosideri]
MNILSLWRQEVVKKHNIISFSGSLIALAIAAPSHAEITILDKNPQSNSLLAPLSLQVGGSIRPEWVFTNGPDANKSNKRGHDGGSRVRFRADYKLTDHTSVIGYYEWGFNVPHFLGMKGNYEPGSLRDRQRQLYAGFKDDRYGTLTYGHQYGIYYSVVGIKSDVWDNDGHAGATGVGFNGDYDGSNRPKNSIMYKNTFGPVTLSANYLLPEDQKDDGSGTGRSYRRNHGAGFGFDYAIMPTLSWAAAYSSTEANVKNSTTQKGYNQQVSGTALTWQPGNWYLTSTASYYKNFVPSTSNHTVSHYFAGSGYGLEEFVGYTFNIDKPFLKSIQPYVAVDSLRLKGDENYHANHVYLGAGTEMGHGLSVYLERTIATTTDNEPDSTWITVFYNF